MSLTPVETDQFPTLFFAGSSDLYINFDLNGVVIAANPAWQIVTGNDSGIEGSSIYNLMCDNTRNDFIRQLDLCRENHGSRSSNLQLACSDGKTRWYSCYLYHESATSSYHALFRDITDQVIAAEQTVQRDERLQILVDNVNEYLYSVQYRDGMFVNTFHNRQCEKITGYSADEFAAQPDLWYTMIHRDDRQLVIDSLETLKLTKKPFYIEHRIIHKSGAVRWISNSCVAVVNEFEKKFQYIGFILDISDKKNRENELYTHATFDFLTGIYNRRAGLKALERCISKSLKNNTPCTICYFDINNLKEVNDRLGHYSGDDMIKTAVMIVQNELRSSDVFTRIGGDEFLLIFGNTSMADSQTIVRRIIKAIVDFNSERKRPYRLYVSYGFAGYTPRQEPQFITSEQLLQTADKEMYFYKERSREYFKSAVTSPPPEAVACL